MKDTNELTPEKETNQMSLLSETSEVIKFLEFAGDSSILNEHTVNCRLTACNNLFSILTEGEDSIDYILQNLEVLIHRFRNKNNLVQASTLKVYKSRVKSSLEDFRAWTKDALAWEKTVNDKSRILQQHKANKLRAPTAVMENRAPEPIAGEGAEKSVPSSGQKMSFPIRPNVNVEVVLPPEGLTLKDLLRLGLFLYPYCKDNMEHRDESAGWSPINFVKN
jgi:hypothetical protein